MWDARVYYADPGSSNDVQGIVRNFDADFAGVDGLYLAGHASLGYSLWLVMFQMIKESSASVQVADIALAGISIFAYYQILRKMLGGRISDKMSSLAAIPYAFSPFVLGMVENLNLDSPSMYFLVIFIACSLYRLRILELALAGLLCFTKEPSLIYYVVYIVTKVICEYSIQRGREFRLGGLVKYGFSDIGNYIYALPAILWIVLKRINSVWGGEVSWSNTGINCFGLDISVIEMKLKQIFLLNFNWIFWVILLCGVICLIMKKVKPGREFLMKVLPVCSVGIIAIAFGCLYVTWTHVRYIVPVIPMLYLTVTGSMAHWATRGVFGGVNIIISALLLVQSFYVIDPVTSGVFDSIFGKWQLHNFTETGWHTRALHGRR